jgi:SPP1 family predicted phage head-tail adaptor
MSALSLRLNKRVTLQSQSDEQDATGQPLNTWVDVAPVWAEVIDVSGREYLAAGGVQNSAQTKITIRYRDGVLPSMRVLHGESVYNIEAVLGQDQRALLLMCSRAD